jgi:hypothetical protein
VLTGEGDGDGTADAGTVEGDADTGAKEGDAETGALEATRLGDVDVTGLGLTLDKVDGDALGMRTDAPFTPDGSGDTLVVAMPPGRLTGAFDVGA